MIDTTPTYNLKVVLKETGLAADTLRAWERRYRLPTPVRSAGGHRLYSQRDIGTIKWLMARQAEGLSISRAVDLWNEQSAAGLDLLASSTPVVLTTQISPANYPAPESSLDSLRAQWLAACLNFSESNAEQVLNQSFSIFPFEVVCREILQKGLAEIGNLWYENRATVQQEHFASSLAIRRLDALLSASPSPSRDQIVLVGCPKDEWHTFTPLLLTLLLRYRGLPVIYLGANIPVARFQETVSSIRADLVILVAQTLTSAANLQITALTLTDLNIPIGFGGRIFNLQPSLVDSIPGHFLGDSVDSSINEVNMVLKGKYNANPLKPISQKYLASLQAFTSRRAHIENTVKELVQPLSISPEDLNTAILFLGDNIAAALQLGDMEHASEEVEWLKVLLMSYQRPPQQLAEFMEKYSLSVDKHINGQGEPIKVWLSKQASRVE